MMHEHGNKNNFFKIWISVLLDKYSEVELLSYIDYDYFEGNLYSVFYSSYTILHSHQPYIYNSKIPTSLTTLVTFCVVMFLKTVVILTSIR